MTYKSHFVNSVNVLFTLFIIFPQAAYCAGKSSQRLAGKQRIPGFNLSVYAGCRGVFLYW